MLVAIVPAAEGRPFAETRETASSADLAGVVYTPNTVLVPSAVVSAELASISADGNTFTFKAASGPLGTLTAGDVLLLQGKAVGIVTHVGHPGGKLVVATRPAAVTDFIQSGTIAGDPKITFAGATLTPATEPPPDVTFINTTRLSAAGVSAAERARVRSAVRFANTYTGAAGPIAYKATLSPTTNRLDFSATYDFDKNGLEGTINLDGYLDSFAAQIRMLVANDQVKSSSFLAKPLDGHLRVTWKLGRADTTNYTIKAPVFTLPFSVTRPFIIGGIPFFATFQTQTLFTIAITAKTGIIEGGAELDYNGSSGGIATNGTLTTEGAEKVAGQFLSAAGSLTLASSAALLAFNLPKITVGIGLPNTINGTANIDVITSLGQTTGSAVAGQSCSKYDLDFSVKTGLGAQLFKTVPALPSKVLYDKKVSRTEGAGPGC